MTTEEGGAQAREYLAKYAADRVRNFGSVWMGATLGCAECHDHKYDPYSTRDFYALAAFFADLQQDGRRHAEADAQRALGLAGGRVVAAPIADRQAAGNFARTTVHDRRNPAEQLAAARAAKARLERQIRSTVVVDLGPSPRHPRPASRRLDGRVRRGRRARRAAVDEAGRSVPPAAVPRGSTWPAGWSRPTIPRRPASSSTGSGSCSSAPAWSTRSTTSGPRASGPPTPSCSTGWRSSSGNAAGTSSRWSGCWSRRRPTASRRGRATTSPRSTRRTGSTPGRRRSASTPSSIRDNALAVSGLLVRTIGGESVRPYQPAGYWRFLNFPKREYVAEHGPRPVPPRPLHPLAAHAAPPEPARLRRPEPRDVHGQAADLEHAPGRARPAERPELRRGRPRAGGAGPRGGRPGRRPSPGLGLATRPFPNALTGRARHPRRPAEASTAPSTRPTATRPASCWASARSPPIRALDPAELAAWTSVARALLNLDETITRD